MCFPVHGRFQQLFPGKRGQRVQLGQASDGGGESGMGCALMRRPLFAPVPTGGTPFIYNG